MGWGQAVGGRQERGWESEHGELGQKVGAAGGEQDPLWGEQRPLHVVGAGTRARPPHRQSGVGPASQHGEGRGRALHHWLGPPQRTCA